MFDLNPFDMDMDGNVDGIDFLGFDYLMRELLGPDESEDRYEESELDEDDYWAGTAGEIKHRLM